MCSYLWCCVCCVNVCFFGDTAQLHLTPARVILSLPIPAAAQVNSTTDTSTAADTSTTAAADGTDSAEQDRVHVDLDVTLSAHANARVMYEAKKRSCTIYTIVICNLLKYKLCINVHKCMI
jgi:hypothetical protein